MIYIFNKIESKYFSENNVDEYAEDYTLEEMNINIDIPTEVTGEATLTGNINISTALKALENISLCGEVKNTNNSVIFSKYGDIIIDSQNVNLNGLVYAPFGDVVISAQNLSLNNVVIIADTIFFDCPNLNANYSTNVAEFVENKSDILDIPKEEWRYLTDENEDGIPDLFEDFKNWEKLADFDEDGLPNAIEEYIGSNVNNIDTDNDSLNDYYEFFATQTDPTKMDTNDNSIDDANEDFDNDGLNNLQESLSGTHPLLYDSDEDGFNDGEELQLYFTDPLIKDSDCDGLYDGEEPLLGTDPLNPDTNNNTILDGNEKIEQDFLYDIINNDCPITQIELTMNMAGYAQRNIAIDSVMNVDLMSTNIVGLVGEPFDINCSSEFDYAKITFKLDSSKLVDTRFENLIFLWHDEENHVYRELPTQYDYENLSISTEVTHFSKHMIVDKEKWYDAWAEDLYDNELIVNNNTVLVIDCSGSMSYNDQFVNGTCGRIEAATGFINVARDNDYIAIIAEDSHAKVLCDFTNDKSVLTTAASKVYSSGGNNFVESLTLAVDKLNALGNENKKNIIFMSDGGCSINNAILDYINESEVNVICIGYGSYSNDSILKQIATSEENFYKAITSEELIRIYSTLGIENTFDTTDTDGDGLADVFEISGMRLENGQIICTDPTEKDSDYDNFSDGEEIIPEYRYLSGNGIPESVKYGTRAIYFVMNSNPNKNELQKGEYGVVEYNGIYYCIHIPNHFGSYWNPVWEEVAHKQLMTGDSPLDIISRFIAGYTFEDIAMNEIQAGGNRLDIPKISLKTNSSVGIFWGFVYGVVEAAKESFEFTHTDFLFQKSGNMYRVIIKGGYTRDSELYYQYADNEPHSAYQNAPDTFTKEMISLSTQKLYEQHTGNEGDFWDIYDYMVTVDSRHKSIYTHYLWILEDGTLMARPILYPKDQVIIGKRNIFNPEFIPLLEVKLSDKSVVAGVKYQDMYDEVFAE